MTNYVRKLVLTMLAVSIAGVQAAFVATDPAEAPVERRPVARAADRTERTTLHAQARAAQRAAAREATPTVRVPPALQAIAECESHGNPRSIGGGGRYRGKYQMTYGAWAGVGGKGDPAAAAEAEQDRRALVLYERSGAGQWPACGQ